MGPPWSARSSPIGWFARYIYATIIISLKIGTHLSHFRSTGWLVASVHFVFSSIGEYQSTATFHSIDWPNSIWSLRRTRCYAKRFITRTSPSVRTPERVTIRSRKPYMTLIDDDAYLLLYSCIRKLLSNKHLSYWSLSKSLLDDSVDTFNGKAHVYILVYIVIGITTFHWYLASDGTKNNSALLSVLSLSDGRRINIQNDMII